ncbi:MAG: endonuclease/exonuclease/phosphatase family protein, partial [Brochothrix sp.]
MKFLTLNTHSLMGDYDCPQAVTLANFISHNDVDVIALQEVNQSIAADTVTTLPSRYYNCSTIPLKNDNFALEVINHLATLACDYYFTWLPSHIGYDRYDEGLALLSKKPIIAIATQLIS